jgi:glutamate-1-semialdehyde 2,1-aminomutase
MAEAIEQDVWARRLEAVTRRYAERHRGSLAAMERMAAWMPGGDTRSTTWFAPFPIVMESAAGAVMRDADGNHLLDFLNNYTALVHGHRPPFVVAALQKALERDWLFGGPMPEQGALAEHIVKRLPSAEQVRFCNSGTEATLLAARIARAYTGRRQLAVAKHSYHGSAEDLVWEAAGHTGTTVFPADDPDAAEQVLRAAGQLAAVFVEPVLGSGGVIEVPVEVLRRLRRFAHEHGALLVFDEVQTLRLAYGGMQEKTGVLPDLTALGKIIGGGIPIGAVAGRADVLAVTDPRRKDRMEHSGTFNGNRLAMAGGLAALQALDRPAIERLNGLGARLAEGLRAVAEDTELPFSVTASGSLLNVHAARNVTTADQAEAAAASPLRRLFHLGMVDRGVFVAHRGELCCSTPMTDTEVDAAVAAFRDLVEDLEAMA